MKRTPLPISLLLSMLAVSAVCSAQSISPSITFSTILGGSGNDEIDAVVTDLAGNIYIAGTTSSTDLPVTASAYMKMANGAYPHVFIAKLNPQASAILYLTYLGGSHADQATTIAVDGTGNAYVGGTTQSSDFPVTTGAVQTNYGGAGLFGDAFITKLNATGSALIYSTFLGGGKDDLAESIVVNAQGEAFIAGATRSANFPVTAGTFQTSYGGGNSNVSGFGGDAFVTKLDATGGHILYSTYLGGGGEDTALAIAIDAAGDAVVVGGTNSTNFPISPVAVQRSFGGSSDIVAGSGDAFVAKLNPTGTALIFSTFLGGSSGDEAGTVSIDATGNIYVQGMTESTNFPAIHALQGTFGGKTDGFLAKLDPNGAALLYSTCIGGTGSDYAWGVADAAGNVYLGGHTDSLDLPLMNAVQPYYGNTDGYVGRIDPGGSTLSYLTYIGGTDSDFTNVVAHDSNGGLWLAGSTFSPDFPLVKALQSNFQSSLYKAAVTRIVEVPTPPANQTADLAVTFTSDRTSISNGNNIHFTATVTNNGPAAAANAVLQHMVYQRFAFVSAVSSQGSCTGSNYIACALGTLSSGQQATVTVTESVPNNTVTLQGNETVFAAVVSSTADPKMANNSAAITLALNLKGVGGVGSGGASGCFIATAAYGSYLDPHVQVLRSFRDRYLITNIPGRAFVRFYYRHSPPVASVISRHFALRAITRWLLTPVVYSVEFPWLAALLLVLSIIGLVWLRKRCVQIPAYHE